MAIRQVTINGDEILRKKCKPVKEINDRVKKIMGDMLETMREQNGVGIAAPQVGIMKRMFIAEPEPDVVFYMINPEMLEMEGSVDGEEGCLSVPGLYGTVTRPERIKIKATDLDGNTQVYEFEDFYARVMCHENDHLDGTLFIDKARDVREVNFDDEEEYEDEE